MYSLRKLVLAVLLALVPGLLVALPVAEAGKAKRADLVVKAFKVPKKVTQGSTLRVTLKVRNASRKKAARKSVTRVYLSTDRKRGKDISLAKVRTPKVPKGKTRKKVAKLRVPKRVKARRYWVIACADATKKVKETKERNNCRTSKNKVKVAAKKKAPPPRGDFPWDADPIDIQVLSDETGGVRAFLTGWGDKVEMTAPDGTHYELQFHGDPETGGSLLNGTEVVLTPVTRIDSGNGGRGPFTKYHAVDIQPHGLQLLRPATLTVTPPPTSPRASGLSAFSADYSGADLHLKPTFGDPGARSVNMPVTSFSTHGVTPTADPGVDVVASHTPRDPMAQYSQRGRDILQEGGPDADAKMQALMDEVFTDHVQPQLEAAVTDPGLRQAALQEALSILRTMELLGMDTSKWSEYVMEMLEKILHLEIDESLTRCVEQHELAMIPRVLALQRTLVLLGFVEDASEELQEVWKCLRFEVTFTSEIERESVLPLPGHTVGETNSGRYATRVDSMVLELDDWASGVSGRGEISYTDYSLSMVRTNPPSGDNPCLFQMTHTGIGTEPGVASASVVLDVNYYTKSADPGAPPPPRGPIGTLRFEVGNTGLHMLDPSDPWAGYVEKEPTERYREEIRDADCSMRTPTQGTARSWMSWSVARDQIEQDILLSNWNEELLHEYTWDVEKPPGCGGCTVDTRTEYATLKLEHAPQP